MSNDRFRIQTFESTHFLIESTEAPKIKAGGSSNSSILNRFFNAASQDMAMLATRTNILASRADRIETGVAAQTGALLSAFQSVQSSVNAATGYTQILFDLHDSFYINESTSTAAIDHVFGQATLPIQGTTDLLVQTDIYGDKYVSPEVEVSYAVGNTPGALDYLVDPDSIFMLRDEQQWLRPATTQTVWIKLKAPLQFRGLTPNVLEIWPFPCLGLDLHEVAYQAAGGSFTSTWIALDLSYVFGYSASNGVVSPMGPVRLHLPNTPIAQIRIKMVPRFNTTWGLHKLKVYHREYDSSATLIGRDPYSRTIGDTIVRGKDPSDLSTLSVNKQGSQVTVNLTSTDTGYTPVITGILVDI